ncbi:hypothetical protein J437_LFUL014786 [Ladona fulva]|uniref:Uncharacterized protein n=1 Tax=Ladona fulva TaxID=123851 RepID=A0A8K0KH27_LADFU|nr:hypothetical protein J437_LFUL014786 [Ladona fulva]
MRTTVVFQRIYSLIHRQNFSILTSQHVQTLSQIRLFSPPSWPSPSLLPLVLPYSPMPPPPWLPPLPTPLMSFMPPSPSPPPLPTTPDTRFPTKWSPLSSTDTPSSTRRHGNGFIPKMYIER